jgi:putative Mn2+ efflux pump MntP
MIIGKRTGKFTLGTKATFLGGVILVGIAIKQIIQLLELI